MMLLYEIHTIISLIFCQIAGIHDGEIEAVAFFRLCSPFPPSYPFLHKSEICNLQFEIPLILLESHTTGH